MSRLVRSTPVALQIVKASLSMVLVGNVTLKPAPRPTCGHTAAANSAFVGTNAERRCGRTPPV